MGDSSKINNIYLSPDLNILPKSSEVKDLGILMSETVTWITILWQKQRNAPDYVAASCKSSPLSQYC